MTFSIHPLARLTLIASVAALYACGGGGGGNTSTVPTTPGTTSVVGSATGILTDAAIQGVAYTTSSGVTGVTGANGSYNYNPGDTVTFTLGAVTLATVTANGIISPFDLAAGNADKYRNLLVLVQSLDSDGNPNNGITIPAAAAAALPAGLNLAQAVEATFAASIATAVTASGSGGVVTEANAKAHFVAQALPLLASNVYTYGYGGLLRVGVSGEYLQGQVNPSDSVHTGAEHGTMAIDFADEHGFHLIRTSFDVDTNGDAGVNNNSDFCSRLVPVGEGLYSPNSAQANAPCTFTPGNPVSLRKAENDPTGIVGVWAHASATTIKTETFVFKSDGTFLTVDPVHPGVEAGTYTYNTTSKIFTIPTTLPYDTNGGAGLSDGSVNSTTRTFVLSSDGMTIAVTSSCCSSTLYRISK